MGFEKNFQIILICLSVSAVPELAITFLIPDEYKLTTSIYPSTIITSSVSERLFLALSKLNIILPFL